MSKSNYFLFRDKYEKWLKKYNINSLASYCLQTKHKETGLLYFDIIGTLAYNKDVFCAKALFEQWKDDLNKLDNTVKTKTNQLDYLEKYYEFFTTQILRNSNIRLSKEDQYHLMDIKGKVEKFQKNLGYITPQIDGMDSIIGEIGTERLITLAIESSYFFSKEMVNERFTEIKEYIADYNNNQQNQQVKDPAFEDKELPYLPARFSDKKDENSYQEQNDDGIAYFYINGECLCPIYQENYRGNKKGDTPRYGGGNGNTRVCQLIKDRTGYDLGTTSDKKSFKNYIISHIWGQAVDPRYFTNLWNIALVPAWANHLLDKEEKGTLSAVFKATVQAIMTDYYDLKEKGWDSIQMNQPSYNKEAVLINSKKKRRKYTINVICEKKSDGQFGKIITETI